MYTLAFIDLDQHRVINCAIKGFLYRIDIDAVAVRGELNPVSKAGSQVVDKGFGVFYGPRTYKPVNRQLAVRIQGYPGPYITTSKDTFMFGCNILLF